MKKDLMKIDHQILLHQVIGINTSPLEKQVIPFNYLPNWFPPRRYLPGQVLCAPFWGPIGPRA